MLLCLCPSSQPRAASAPRSRAEHRSFLSQPICHSLFMPLLFPSCKPPSHTTPSITRAECRASLQKNSHGSSLLMLSQPWLKENACLGAGGHKRSPSECLVYLNNVSCLLHSWAAAVAQVNWRAIREYHNSADTNNCRIAIISSRATVQCPQITVHLA